MIQLNWQPTVRQLRQFAYGALVLLPLAAWLACGIPRGETWQAWHTTLTGGLAAAGAALVALSYIAPAAVRPVYLAMSLLTWPIGLVVGEIMLLMIYFAVFTPVALCFRLIGRDALERTIDRQATSYWRPKAQPCGAAGYFRQS